MAVPKRKLRHLLLASTRLLRHVLMLMVAEVMRRVVVLLPLRWALALGRAMGRGAARVARKPRQVAERQLLKARVATDPAEAQRLARGVFESFGMNVIEWHHSTGWSPEQFRERVAIDPAPVERLLAEGRGLIIVVGHLGNWEILIRAAHAWLGRRFNAVMAPQRNPWINRWLVRQRERGGDRMHMTDEGALPLLRLLRRGEPLALLIDQDSNRSRGVFIKFFGRPALTPLGPGLLAHHSGAPVLPCAIRRRADNPELHETFIGKPIRPNPELEAEADALRILTKATAFIEARIRETPEQWVWIHRRWRHKPGKPIKRRARRHENGNGLKP